MKNKNKTSLLERLKKALSPRKLFNFSAGGTAPKTSIGMGQGGLDGVEDLRPPSLPAPKSAPSAPVKPASAGAFNNPNLFNTKSGGPLPLPKDKGSIEDALNLKAENTKNFKETGSPNSLDSSDFTQLLTAMGKSAARPSLDDVFAKGGKKVINPNGGKANESKALGYKASLEAPKKAAKLEGYGPKFATPTLVPKEAPSEKGKSAKAMGYRAEDMVGSAENGLYSAAKEEFDTRLKSKIALSLRYRIPSKLNKLDNKVLKKLSDYIYDQVEVTRRNRSQFIQRLAGYRENWKNFDIAGLNLTIEGQHDEHVPVIFEKGKTMHARIYQAVMGVEPIFTLIPRKAVSEVQKQDKEDLLRWVLSEYANNGEGLAEAVDLDIQNFVFDGTSINKHYWCRDVRKFVGVEITEKLPLEVDENGQLVVDEKEVEKEEVQYDGPIMKPLRIEDVDIVGALVEDVDSADMINHRQQYTKSELIKMSNLGFFKKDWVDQVLKKATPSTDTVSMGRDRLLDQQTEALMGIRQDEMGIPTYTIYESYLRYDIDNDGIDEELVVWMEENTRTIIRITYLDRVSPNGKRPFVLKKLIPMEGSPYGLGFGEMLNGISNLTDYIVNQRLDAGTFNTFPWFVFRASSGMTVDDIRIAPGKGIPVDNINDIAFPKVNGNASYGFQEEQIINTYAEKVSGITSLAQGQISGQGATRTATGAAALVQELNTNLDIFIKRYQRGFKKSLKIIDKQCQELLPLGLEFKVLGMNGAKGAEYKMFKDRKAFAWDTDFELAGNSVNSNKAIERDTAVQILQQALNPIMLQTGIVGPQQIYNAYKNFLQKLEIRNIDAYAVSPEGINMSPFSALDEINMISSGVKPPISMNDKHAEKLAVYDQFEQSDEFGIFTQDHLPLYMEAKQAHMKFAEAMAAQAQQAANTGGMINPNLGAQIAGAAGSGNPGGGVPNQVGDLLADTSTLQG